MIGSIEFSYTFSATDDYMWEERAHDINVGSCNTTVAGLFNT